MLQHTPSALVIVALSGAVLSGCGDAPATTGDKITTQTASASSRTSPQGAPTSTTPESSPERKPAHEGQGTVPNEIGAPLAVAERDLAHRGLAYRVLPAAPSAGVVAGHSTVCEMNPAPRTHLESGTTIRLIVAPRCR
jgi:hypothetical protein